MPKIIIKKKKIKGLFSSVYCSIQNRVYEQRLLFGSEYMNKVYQTNKFFLIFFRVFKIVSGPVEGSPKKWDIGYIFTWIVRVYGIEYIEYRETNGYSRSRVYGIGNRVYWTAKQTGTLLFPSIITSLQNKEFPPRTLFSKTRSIYFSDILTYNRKKYDSLQVFCLTWDPTTNFSTKTKLKNKFRNQIAAHFAS